MTEQLGPRQGAVLQALVREHIRTGEPVGSKSLVGRYRLGVSAATVRNDMARLEALQYVAQPHTSAGRIPTDRGYRYYVDGLPPAGSLGAGSARVVEDEFEREPDSLDELLRRATDVLVRITRHTAAVLAPRLRPSRLRRLDLVRLASRTLLVVLVTDSGRVEQHMVSVSQRITDAQLDRCAAALNADLEGTPLDEARRTAAALAARAPERDRPIVEGVVGGIESALGAGDRVYLGGTSSLADEGTLGRDTLRRIYEVLEQQSAVLRLLADGLDGPMTVRIGSEIPMSQMRELSLVAAPYGIGGTPMGTVGVLGPMRMDYARAMATASAVARSLEHSLSSIAG